MKEGTDDKCKLPVGVVVPLCIISIATQLFHEFKYLDCKVALCNNHLWRINNNRSSGVVTYKISKHVLTITERNNNNERFAHLLKV